MIKNVTRRILKSVINKKAVKLVMITLEVLYMEISSNIVMFTQEQACFVLLDR
jgi:hypothetical protein